MDNGYNNIEKCKGVDNCFGKQAGKTEPIIFLMKPNNMKIMVITEQPKGDNIDKDKLKESFENGPKNSIPYRLKELLGEKFYESVINENEIFYWTHYIKCPGEFRKSKGVTDEDLDKCADTHLSKEIEYLKPALIICIGGKCGSWVLKKFESSLSYKNNDWREHLWREISEQKNTTINVKNTEIKVIFLMHPSERSGIGWFIDKKMKNFIQKYIPK